MIRSLLTIAVAVFLLSMSARSIAAEELRSTFASDDVPLSLDPTTSFWHVAHPVYAEKGTHGENLRRYRTEIRSRWTKNNLYLLFICPYDTLSLKPSPTISAETNKLWNWDVAEAFIGSDFQNIKRYKEFEISPQGEWVDLDIDLSNPHHEEGWTWNSGFVVAARIDAAAKIWYGGMRIPFSALGSGSGAPGRTFRINLFRAEGPPPKPVHIVWRPTMSETFHVPEKFGILRLVGPTATK
jgi:hypothetical protein